MNDNENLRQEKTRICPSCRMQISVLATKCRFCGEEVGKPKEEARTLSIHDLGGEQVYHRAPSGSVLDAMESFRAEESMRVMAEGDAASDVDDLGLAQAGEDAGGTGISFDEDPSPAFSTSRNAPAPSGLGSRVKLAGGVVLVLILLVVGATMGPRLLEGLDQSEAEAELPVYENQAPKILASNGPPIEALEAAVEAIDREDSAKNRRIAEDAVAAVEDQVNRLLNATPFKMENLQQASTVATRAASLYPNETTRDLADEVKEENRVYRMILTDIEKGTKVVSFRLNKPGNPVVKVEKGDLLEDRFLVRTVAGTQRVTLVDTKRGNRPVAYEKGTLAVGLS